MTFETIGVTRDDRGVATLRLARPEKHNALSARMIAELTEAAQALGADAATRVVVLAAEGVSFSAGADLGWMRAQFEADRETRMREARRLAEMLGALDALPKPLIARVHGQAFGGGLGLMAVSDAAIVVEGARFGFSETRLGLVPATISPYVIARVGVGRLRRVFASPKVFSAAEAAALGLASAVVAAAELDAAVEAEAAAYLAAAPGAVAASKRLLRRAGAVSAADIEASVAALADAWETEEAREGVSAFLEKRRPAWAPA